MTAPGHPEGEEPSAQPAGSNADDAASLLPGLPDAELDLVNTAVKTLVYTCELSLRLATWPSATNSVRSALLRQAEAAYAAALGLIEELVERIGTRIADRAVDGAPICDEDLAAWQHVMSVYEHMHLRIAGDLERVRELMGSERDARWAAKRVHDVLRTAAGPRLMRARRSPP